GKVRSRVRHPGFRWQYHLCLTDGLRGQLRAWITRSFKQSQFELEVEAALSNFAGSADFDVYVWCLALNRVSMLRSPQRSNSI
ncbi:MAG: hypothetical protein AAF394_16610, partial [Planctomycetota bacterium]